MDGIPMRVKVALTWQLVRRTFWAVQNNPAAQENAKRARAGELGPSFPILVLFGIILCAIRQIFVSDTFELNSVTMANLASPREGGPLSMASFAAIRCVMAMITCTTLLCCVFGESITITASQLSDSKMEGSPNITCKGFARCSSCTVQCWTLQTLYFAWMAYFSVSATFGGDVHATFTTRALLWVLYEVSFTWSLVVTCIVTFVLIPAQVSRGMSLGPMFTWKARVMHNANLLFMVTELLFNDLPFAWSHVAFPILFGMWYAIFSWGWLRFAGIVYYPFIDPSAPWLKSVLIHVALLGGVAGMFCVGLGAGELVSRFPFVPSAVLVYAASFCLMWTGFNGMPKQQVPMPPALDSRITSNPVDDSNSAEQAVRSCNASTGYRGTGHQLRTQR